MSRKVGKTPKKIKQNVERVNRREMVHIDYLNVYNEVLKFEEVLDIDIDVILDVTKSVFSRELSLSKLASSPTQDELQALTHQIIDELRELKGVADGLVKALASGSVEKEEPNDLAEDENYALAP